MTAAIMLVVFTADAPVTPAPPAPPVSIRVVAPSAGTVVSGTATVTFDGSGLASVTLYQSAQPVATATVSPDGTRATALVDTTVFRDGPVELTARGSGAGRRGRQASTPVPLTVDNSVADPHPAGYSMVFDDEFSGTALDRSLWCTRYMYDGGPQLQVPDQSCLEQDPDTGDTLGTLDTLGGNGSESGQEAQVYRDFNVDGLPMQVVHDGYLSLRATATRLDQPYLKYESGMIRSKQEFEPTEGHPLYLTARVRQPDVVGTWPAFWLAGGYGDGRVRPPWPPEIDIFEGPLNKSEATADVLQTAVVTDGCDGPCPQGPFGYSYSAPGLDTQWGAYHAGRSLRGRWIEVGLEWYTDHACWYLDGLKISCQSYRWVANDGPDVTTPAAILLNLAIGGPWAGADGVDDAAFPTSFDIDHVRVYRS